MNDFLLNQEGKRILVIQGAPRIGKRTMVEHFLETKKEELRYVSVDFREHPRLANKLYGGDFTTASILSAAKEMRRVGKGQMKKGPIVFALYNFDWAKDPEAIISKFERLTANFYVILTLSYMDPCLKGLQDSSEMPMYPMDFEEFLWTLGYSDADIASLRKYRRRPDRIPTSARKSLAELYKGYLLIGGMPEAVLEYRHSKKPSSIRKRQRAIRSAISSDLLKQVDGAVLKKHLKILLGSLHKAITRDSKVFKYHDVAEGFRKRNAEDAVRFLIDRRILYRIENMKAMSYPLFMSAKNASFKLYHFDTGLLLSGLDSASIKGFTKGTDEKALRAIHLNAVACALIEKGSKPCGLLSATGVDFILDSKGSLLAVSVRGGHSKAARSLTYLKSNRQRYPITYLLLAYGNPARKGRSVPYMPFYLFAL